MKWIQKIFFLLTVKPLYRLVFKFKTIGLENVKNLSAPVLIKGNHKTPFDSLAVAAAVPITTNLHPCRSMGEVSNFKNPLLKFLKKTGFIKLIYFICGVFPAIRGQGLEVALKIPTEILNNKGIVLMHPEGGLIPGDKIGQFKRGAAVLALKTNTPIAPVVFKLNTKNKDFRKKYYIKFGSSFKVPQNLQTDDAAEYMRKKIIDLYKTLPQNV